jgi:hypothetical protein
MFFTQFLLSADYPEQLFVKHLTDDLPNPTMQIGRNGRTTLHWTLLGLDPDFGIREIKDDGSVTTKDSSLTNCKYAIIERIDQLDILGGEPEDIFSFGPHNPSHHSYMIIPESERATTRFKKGRSKIAYYDDKRFSVKDAVLSLTEQKRLPIVYFKTIGIKDADLATIESDEKFSAFAKQASSYKESVDPDYFTTKEDWHHAYKTGELRSSVLVLSAVYNSQKTKEIIFRMMTDSKPYFIWKIIKNIENDPVDLNALLTVKNDCVRQILVFSDGSCFDFDVLMQNFKAENKWIRVNHNLTGLTDLEIELAKIKIMYTIKKTFNEQHFSSFGPLEKTLFSLKLMLSFTETLNEKLKDLSDNRAAKFRSFYMKEFKNYSDEALESITYDESTNTVRW